MLRKLAKRFGFLVLGIVAITFASIPLARLESPDSPVVVDNSQPLAIDNVSLVTMIGEEVLSGRQLLVRDGLIEGIIEAGAPVSPDYRIIDGGGGYVIPGLFDMHCHAMDRKYLVSALAAGVTSVRNMGGYPMHLRWRRELADGEWLGSTLYSATPTMNGSRNANPLGHKVFEDTDDARQKVREYAEEGWDFIKVYARLEVDVYKAIIDEAQTLDFPVAGHVPYPVVETDYTLASPLVTLEHTEDIYQGPLHYEFDDTALLEVVQRLRDMDATVTPTLMIFDHLTRIARDRQAYLDTVPMEYLNPLMRAYEDRSSGARWLNANDRLRDSLERRNDYFSYITRVLHENDVNLVVGSDCGVIYAVPGVATHEEMALMHKAGIPAHDVLRMATINAAEVLRVEGRVGSIEAGKIADLVITRQNPIDELQSLREPLAVIKNGQWLSEGDLQTLDQSARQPSGIYLTIGRILEFVLFG